MHKQEKGVLVMEQKSGFEKFKCGCLWLLVQFIGWALVSLAIICGIGGPSLHSEDEENQGPP
ncbi:hypothetical protein ACFL14_03035 [Patescibacteria group bacterium]